MLNDAMKAIIVPIIRRQREEYFVVKKRVPVVDNQRAYRIPPRAVGGQIRNLYWWDGTTRHRMRKVEPDDEHLYQGNDTAWNATPWFMLEGMTVVLPDSFEADGSLEFSFMIRPGQLVLSTDARIITNVDNAEMTLTVDSTIPAEWVSTVRGFDVHSPESGAELKMFDLTKVDAVGVSVMVGEALDGSVFGSRIPAIGDYLCLAGEAVVPALPVEWHIPLAQAAVVAWHEAQGDTELWQASKQTLKDMLENLKVIAASRAEAHPKKTVSRGNPLWGGSRRSGNAWFR
jgi:hypothetical protein